MKTLRVMVMVFAAGTLGLVASCSSGGGGGGGEQEICNNGIDDDGDGFTDCDDAECTSALNCTAQCGNGQCEAGETATSCPADCGTTAEICNNQMDDDGDGFTDCDDADCTTDPACQAGTEICDNNTDDDGDALVDCDDSDCATDPACQTTSGDLSCIGLNQCYSCCGQDQSCYTACDGAASSEATTQMNAFYTCLSTNCQTECQDAQSQACQDCIDQNCTAEIDACDWSPAGSAGCMTTYGCLVGNGSTIQGCPTPASSGTGTTCPSDPGLVCYQGCFGAADQNAMDLFFSMNDCILAATDAGGACENDCTDPQSQACGACINSACSTEIGACQADG